MTSLSAPPAGHRDELPGHAVPSAMCTRSRAGWRGTVLLLLAACAIRTSSASFSLNLPLPRIPQQSSLNFDADSPFNPQKFLTAAVATRGPFQGYDVPIGIRSVLSGIAGGIAGSGVSFLLHPIDTLKTVTQDKGRNYKSFLDAGIQVCKEKGVVTGLYAGARTAALGSFISSGVYFSTYQTMREKLVDWLPAVKPCTQACLGSCTSTDTRLFTVPEEWQSLTPSLAAVSGNAVSSLIFVPKEVLKQRCQVGQLQPGQRALGLMRKIVQTEGIGAMYQGYLATLMRNAPARMALPDVVKTRIMLGQVTSRFPPKAIMQITREEGLRVLWIALESIFKSAALQGFIPGVEKEHVAKVEGTNPGPGLPDIPKLVAKYYDVTQHVLLTR